MESVSRTKSKNVYEIFCLPISGKKLVLDEKLKILKIYGENCKSIKNPHFLSKIVILSYTRILMEN